MSASNLPRVLAATLWLLPAAASGQAAPASLAMQLPLPCGSTAYVYCGYEGDGGVYGACPLHTGVDRYALDFTYAFNTYSPDHALGEPVTAVAAGAVVEARSATGYGQTVLVAHDTPDGVYNSLYAHLDSISVSAGQQVVAGEELGKLGRSGGANGVVHLHFVLRKGGGIGSGEAVIPEPMSGHTGIGPESEYPVRCEEPPPPDAGTSTDAHPSPDLAVPPDTGVAGADGGRPPDASRPKGAALFGGCGLGSSREQPGSVGWLLMALATVGLARLVYSRATSQLTAIQRQ